MKTYELLDIEGVQVLKATEGEKVYWIPFHEGNTDYAEYLRYTAWVKAGNTPEDFWTQDDELIEPSEPKEEEETPQETEGES